MQLHRSKRCGYVGVNQSALAHMVTCLLKHTGTMAASHADVVVQRSTGNPIKMTYLEDTCDPRWRLSHCKGVRQTAGTAELDWIFQHLCRCDGTLCIHSNQFSSWPQGYTCLHSLVSRIVAGSAGILAR